MGRCRFFVQIFIEVLLGADIVATIVSQEVSVLSFVCVALIAMLEVGTNLHNERYNRKHK